MRLFNPSIVLEVLERTLTLGRARTQDTMRIEFSVKACREVQINGEKVNHGSVSVSIGDCDQNRSGALGQIRYLEAHSKDNGEHCSLSLQELLRMKEEHAVGPTGEESFPLDYLIEPAAFNIHLFVGEQFFKELLAVNLQESSIFLRFTFNPKTEGSLEYQRGLFDDLILIWDQTMEDFIPAETFEFSIQSKAANTEPAIQPISPAPPQPSGLPPTDMRTPGGMFAIQKTLNLCAWLLAAVLVAVVVFRR